MPKWPFYLPPKRKIIFLFVLKVKCPQYTYSLPNSGNCYFLVFQNACPNLTCTCSGQSGKCLFSTLICYLLILQNFAFVSPFLPLLLFSQTQTLRLNCIPSSWLSIKSSISHLQAFQISMKFLLQVTSDNWRIQWKF